MSTQAQPVYLVSPNATEPKTRLGLYFYQAGNFTVQASAHGATAGFFWLINPVGSAVQVRIKHIDCVSQLTSALVATSAPRITVERVTFTGTASGASVTPAKQFSTDAANVSSLRTASTGLSLSAGAAAFAFLPIASATAVGYNPATFISMDNAATDALVLTAGEGIVMRQPDAGTASDTRKLTFNIIVEEL